MQPNELDTLTTFTLEACKRLAEVLGDDAPKVSNQWVGTSVWDETMQSDYETPSTPKRSTWVPAYRLDDLDGATWKKIVEKLGWQDDKFHYYPLVWGYKDNETKIEVVMLDHWENIALSFHQAWLTGGYPEASKYLIDILQGYGNQTQTSQEEAYEANQGG